MALQSLGGNGFVYPTFMQPRELVGWAIATGILASAGTMDAQDEKVAFIGYTRLANNATNKTFSNSSSILWNAGTTTFANAGTTLRVGLQDISTSAGPPVEPDGTFDVYDDLVGGTDTITSGSWITSTMSSGTKTISHGDLIAIVLHMTARGGSDSVIARSIVGTYGTHNNLTHAFTTAWSVGSSQPLAILSTDDGTLGCIDGGHIGIPTAYTAYTDSTNPDEYALAFQVPFNCTVDMLTAFINYVGATSDATITLYSDPFGTPTTMQSVNILGEQSASANAGRYGYYKIPETELNANTDYAIGLKATGAGNLILYHYLLPDASYRSILSGGTNLGECTRNNGSGAFSTPITGTRLPYLGIRISKLDDGGPTNDQIATAVWAYESRTLTG